MDEAREDYSKEGGRNEGRLEQIRRNDGIKDRMREDYLPLFFWRIGGGSYALKVAHFSFFGSFFLSQVCWLLSAESAPLIKTGKELEPVKS